mgnify:CR=1 FL=1
MGVLVDNIYMRMSKKSWGEWMIQFIGILIAILGLTYNGVKDYQKGDIKFPKITHQAPLTKIVYPVQYCLMAYDPNVDKVFYLHENGQWHDYAPQIRKYQNQNQTTVENSNRASGTPGYNYGQQAQANTNPIR